MNKTEAVEVLQDYLNEIRGFIAFEVGSALDLAIEALQDRPTGVWVDKGGYNECSECGEVAQKVELCDCVYERLTNFCPNCGADMRGE